MIVERQVVPGRLATRCTSLSDGGSSHADREPATRAVRDAVAEAVGPSATPHVLIMNAREYSSETARRLCERVRSSSERVRVVDSLRLEVTRLLAGVAAEHDDLLMYALVESDGPSQAAQLAVLLQERTGPAAVLVDLEVSVHGLHVTCCTVQPAAVVQSRPMSGLSAARTLREWHVQASARHE